MNLLGSRKGQGVGNVLAGIVLIFTFSISILINFTMVNSFVTEFTNAGFLETEAAQSTAANFLRASAVFDWVTVFLLVAVIIGIAVTSYRVASAPVFFVITFIFAAFIGFISYFFNSIFGQIATNAVFSTTIMFFPRTLLITTNLHWIALAMIVIGAITLYGKKEKGQFLS